MTRLRSFIDISDHDYNILISILKRYEATMDFYAFGSRVTGKAKKYSDLDIAYEQKKPQSIAKLRNELEDSNLAITVDLVDLNNVDIEFAELIRSQMIPL